MAAMADVVDGGNGKDSLRWMAPRKEATQEESCVERKSIPRLTALSREGHSLT
jgi:hypothetical protein